jgi:hypothetical protein
VKSPAKTFEDNFDRSLALIWAICALWFCVQSYASAAERLDVPKFKNVDEAIGWIKGKGKCESSSAGNKDARCEIAIQKQQHDL